MTKQIKSKGFTIVELLIVIVVIAILAAITIVAYNGIQNRAHTTSQKTAAENVGKKIEAYNAVQSAYPTYNSTAGAITTALATVADSSLTGSGLTLGTPSATTPDTTVQLQLCSTAAQTSGTTVPTGWVIYIWDRTINTAGLNPVQAGGATSITAGTGGAVNTVGGTATTCNAVS
jgi:prepilin-type N-terminal cleavage/methylation domain-containing protein